MKNISGGAETHSKTPINQGQSQGQSQGRNHGQSQGQKDIHSYARGS